MPLEPGSFTAAVLGVAGGKIPTAAAALRSNPLAGVIAHNPFMEMVKACCTGWLTTIMAPGIIVDSYNGVTGPLATAIPTPFLFTRAAPVSAAFQSSMAWAGTHSTLVAQALTLDIWNQTMAMGVIQMFPLPGGAVGAGVVNPLTLSGLGPAFTANLNAAFMASGYFSLGDLKAVLTPEISLLITNLSAAYAMNMGGLSTANPIVYTGAPVPAPPASPVPYTAIPNAGSII